MKYKKPLNFFPNFLHGQFSFPIAIAIIAIVLAIISMLNLQIYHSNQKQLIREFQQEHQIVANAIGINLSNTFHTIYKELRFYALDPRIRSSDSGKLNFALKNLYSNLTPFTKAVSRVDSNGILIATFPPDPSAVGKNISNQPHIQYLLTHHKSVISKPIHAIQGYKAVIMHEPVFQRKNGHRVFAGSLAALTSVEFFPKLFQQLISAKKQWDYTFVIDQDGTIISHNNPRFIGQNLTTIAKLSISKDSLAQAFRTHQIISLLHKSTLLRNAFIASHDIKIANFDYRLFIASSRSELSHPLKLAYLRQLLVWAISLIIIISLLIIIIRSYHRWTDDLNNELDNRTRDILESEKKFKDLFMESIEGIYQSTLNGKFIKVNPAFAKMLGYDSPHELANVDIAQTIYFRSDERKIFIQKLLDQGHVQNFQYVLKRKDGSLLFGLESARLLSLPDGTQFIQGSIMDITQRVSYEDKLKHNQVFLSRLLTYSKDINQEISLKGIFTKVTQSVTENFSFPFAWLGIRDPKTKEIQIRSWSGGGEQLIQTLLEDCDNLSAYLEKILNSCSDRKTSPIIQDFESLFCEKHQKTADELGYKSIIFLPIIIRGDIFLGFIALYSIKKNGFSKEDMAFLQTFLSLTNISIERALYFGEIKESEQKYASLVEHASDGICILQDGVFKFVNAQLLRMLGYEAHEILEKSFAPFISPESLPKVARNYKDRMAGKPVASLYIIKVVRKNGVEIPVELSISPITFNGRPALLDIVRDLSYRRKTEQALQESEIRYRHLFQNALIGITQFFPDGSFLTVNATMTQMLNYSNPDQLLHINFQNLLKDSDKFNQLISELEKTGKVTNFEATFICRDGSEIIVQSNLRIEKDKNGKWLYIEGIHQNISERKRLEQQLIQAQKMESIGILVGGIAHDFNNILTGIIGSANFMLEDLSPTHPSFRDAQQIVELGERAARLIHQLLTFSRKNDVSKEILDLNYLLKESVKLFHRTFPENIIFEMDINPGTCYILANPEQIHQILLNLSINARDAMPQGGVISFKTEIVAVSEEHQAFHTHAKPGNYLLLSVSDTGNGIPEKIIDKIFDPFFTTKTQGKGTGLGLSVVYGIVKSNNGFIHVYSIPNKGTTFRIYFPIIHGENNKSLQKTTSIRTNGKERILFVEDEDFVRKTGVRILESRGYSVISAADGTDALELFKQEKDQIELVISDVIMPQMSGPQFIQEMLRIKPSQKFFFVSGYSAGKIELKDYNGKIEIIPKPFHTEEFLQKVRDTLDSNGTHSSENTDAEITQDERLQKETLSL